MFSCLRKTTKSNRVQPSTLANLTKSTGTHTNTVGHLPRQSHQSTSNADLCLSRDDSPLNKDGPSDRSQGFEGGISSQISSTMTNAKVVSQTLSTDAAPKEQTTTLLSWMTSIRQPAHFHSTPYNRVPNTCSPII